jgi:tight adherence protein B
VSAAALALAAALLVAPAVPRWRIAALRAPRRRRRVPGMAVAALAAVAGVVFAPGTVVLAGVIGAGTVALRRRRRAAALRRTAESAALRAALDTLVGELRIGAHPVTAFTVAAGEVDGVVSASLVGVAARARLGADVAAGLRGAAVGSAVPGHWERLAVCWQLAHTHGLAIATLMRSAQRDLVERERFSARVDATLAGARATAGLLAGLPLLGVSLGQLIGADPVRFLLSGGVGGWLLVAGVTLVCCGLLWCDRITDRVLA